MHPDFSWAQMEDLRQGKVQGTRNAEGKQAASSANLGQEPPASVETEGDQESLIQVRRAAVLAGLQEKGGGETRGKRRGAGKARAAKPNLATGQTSKIRLPQENEEVREVGTSTAASGQVAVKEELRDYVVKPQVLARGVPQEFASPQDGDQQGNRA